MFAWLGRLFGSRKSDEAQPQSGQGPRPPAPAPPPFVVPFSEGRFEVDPLVRSTLMFAMLRQETVRILYRGAERDVRPTGVESDYLTAVDPSDGGAEKRFRLDQIEIPGMARPAPDTASPVPARTDVLPNSSTFTVSVKATIEETGDSSWSRDYKPVIDPVVRERLAKAVEAGATVRIVYYGGHRPGSIRDVRPLWITTDDKLRATDLTEGIDKTFRLEKIALAAVGVAVTHVSRVRRVRPSVRTAVRTLLLAGWAAAAMAIQPTPPAAAWQSAVHMGMTQLTRTVYQVPGVLQSRTDVVPPEGPYGTPDAIVKALVKERDIQEKKLKKILAQKEPFRERATRSFLRPLIYRMIFVQERWVALYLASSRGPEPR
jgi:hypothetical protein